LPTEEGRLQILQIHTKQLQKNGLLHGKCNLSELARLTKNYTGA
jgi:vesicle-fusing ATPase